MDCDTSFDALIARCLDTGINCIAVTDHGTIAGAKEFKEMAPFTVIVAEEIFTPQGEIMGMFLSDEITSGTITPREVVTQIHAQGGLVCIPHPCDRLRGSALTNEALMDIIDDVDILEVFNARTMTPGANSRARKLAAKYDKLSSAGSDAHVTSELGATYIELPAFEDKTGFVESLAQGRIVSRRSSFFVHLASTRAKHAKSRHDSD
jgi:predicted metal-dependent phosphoesterase TrpH